MHTFLLIFIPLVLGWFAASYFALKGYNVLSYFIKGEQYAAGEAKKVIKKL